MSHDHVPLGRRLIGEVVGTALLLIAVVGSGIMAQKLSPNDVGLQLLENAFATGVALVAIILAIGPVSGAHLNPVVTGADRYFGGITTRAAVAYCGAQTLGALVGVMIANLMFDYSALELSTKVRTGSNLFLSEIVATVGLLLVIFAISRSGRSRYAAFAVGAYIAGAYFFTSSTSFANPAVTVGRMFSDTFAGIDPSSVPAFIGAQLLWMVLAVGLVVVLYPHKHPEEA